jgi:predicted class III extradiol MEMO1 family dioxygenase
VGARFGDPDPLDQEMLEAIRQIDEAALAAAATGNADTWFDAIAAHADSTRVCGYSATFAMLAAARPGPGALLRYEQSLEEGGSVVTCATLAWPASETPR